MDRGCQKVCQDIHLPMTSITKIEPQNILMSSRAVFSGIATMDDHNRVYSTVQVCTDNDITYYVYYILSKYQAL